MYFNSQPHEEADGYGIRKTSKETISTHSLTKRLTTFQPCLRGKKTISTHSLTKRLTHYIVLRSVCTGYFNSQPHEEADEDNNVDNRTDEIFQLTASRRG